MAEVKLGLPGIEPERRQTTARKVRSHSCTLTPNLLTSSLQQQQQVSPIVSLIAGGVAGGLEAAATVQKTPLLNPTDNDADVDAVSVRIRKDAAPASRWAARDEESARHDPANCDERGDWSSLYRMLDAYSWDNLQGIRPLYVVRCNQEHFI
jgi:hypothetical protein